MAAREVKDGSVLLQRLPPHGEEDETSREARDRVYLLRTGKRPVMKRNFGFISILSFSLLVLNTWSGSFL